MSCCQASELDHISDAKVSHFYRKGQIIFQEGAPALGGYCVHQGKIKITKAESAGKEQIIRLAKPCDTLGINTIISGQNHSASAVALDDCIVCFIPRADFLRTISANAQFAASLLQLLAKALGDAEARMLHLAYRPVRERLAEALLLLRNTYQEDNAAEPFSMSISREDLASLVGTAKETAIRLLADLKESGVIATQGSLITICQPEQLVKTVSMYE